MTCRLGRARSARVAFAIVVALLLAPLMMAAAEDQARARTSITGAAWYANDQPLAKARVRLRNVVTGKIDATAVADDNGRFAFAPVDGGTYAIELVNDAGNVLAIGTTFTAAPGETVATFVRLNTEVPWFAGFFNNAALAVTATAAAAGITALAADEQRPVSARK